MPLPWRTLLAWNHLRPPWKLMLNHWPFLFFYFMGEVGWSDLFGVTTPLSVGMKFLHNTLWLLPATCWMNWMCRDLLDTQQKHTSWLLKFKTTDSVQESSLIYLASTGPYWTCHWQDGLQGQHCVTEPWGQSKKLHQLHFELEAVDNNLK